MKRHVFLLLLLPALLGIALWFSSQGTQSEANASSDEGARRLTEGAKLLALEGWPSSAELLAVGDDASRLLVDGRTGTFSTTEAPASMESMAGLSVEVDGVTHRLYLDGELLFETSEEILGRPTLSPDRAWLVIERYPHGTETASLGELWRYDLNSQEWTLLTKNGVEETSPVISPDGQRVAFLRDGDIWTVPAHRTTVESLVAREPVYAPLALGSREPPETIRVIHGVANTCRKVPVGQIDTIPFEEYVKRVVPHESPDSWHMEALKAQAVAARTYAWYQMQGRADEPYDVTDTTSNQYMCDSTKARTNEAVDATRGQHLTYSGALISAMFSAENSSATRQNSYGHRYLSAVDDPLSFGYKRYGHGQGYSQWGAKRLADAGWSHSQILRHYYMDARVETAAGDSQTLLDVANRPTRTYLRGSALYMELNANNVTSTRAREWRPDSSGTLQHGTWQEDTNGFDGWSHLFPLLALPDLPAGRYRVEAASTPDTPSSQRPVLYLGIDRSPPRMKPAITITRVDGAPAVQVNFGASDATSGLERAGWSFPGWRREAEALQGEAVFRDAAASGGAGVRLDPARAGAHTLSFPSFTVSPDQYRVWFRLHTAVLGDRERVATLRLFDGSRVQRGVRYLRASDFNSRGWEWFYVDVDTTWLYTGKEGNDSGTITAEIEWHGSRGLDVDRILLATRPDTLLTKATVKTGSGGEVTLYVSDQAGNARMARCTFPTSGTATTKAVEALAGGAKKLFLPLVSHASGAIGCAVEE